MRHNTPSQRRTTKPTRRTNPARQRAQVQHRLPRAADLVRLYEANHAMAQQDKLPALVEIVVTSASRLLGARGVGLFWFEQASAELVLMSQTGLLDPPLPDRVKLGEGLAGRAAQKKEPLTATGSSLPRSTGSILAVPMCYRGDLIGVLELRQFDSTARAFSAADSRLMELFATHAGSALYNADLFEQVRASRERLQTLSRQLLEAQETERRHLARELHDEIGQVLTAVKVNLQRMQLRPEAAPLNSTLEDSIETVEHALAQVRSISLDLRPSVLDDFGLAPALKWLVGRLAQRGHFNAQFRSDPFESRLPASIETACFRVAQEALTNVLRHAQAQTVTVELADNQQHMELVVRDDGVGFDTAAAAAQAAQGVSLGLLGMQEHAALVGGFVTITSVSRQGTEVRAEFPTTLTEPLERRRHRRDR